MGVEKKMNCECIVAFFIFKKTSCGTVKILWWLHLKFQLYSDATTFTI